MNNEQYGPVCDRPLFDIMTGNHYYLIPRDICLGDGVYRSSAASVVWLRAAIIAAAAEVVVAE
jgi:hypothetical protein